MEIHDFDDDHLQSVLHEDEADENEMKEDTTVQFSAATLGNSLMQTPDISSKKHSLEKKQIICEENTEFPSSSHPAPSYELKIENCIQIDTVAQTKESPKIRSSIPSTSPNKHDCINEEETDFSLSDYELNFIPKGMPMPTSQRLNDIIRMTSVKTSAAPQFEVLLKLKQAENTEFGFLKPEHTMNPYYLFLKERGGEVDKPIKPKEEKEMPSEKSPNEKDSETNGDGIGGLLGMYASSSDEEDDESPLEECVGTINGTSLTVTANDKASNTSEAGELTKAPMLDEESSSKADDERKAKRLKRARNLKGHFALKLMEK